MIQTSFDVPYKTPALEKGGMLTPAWVAFFRALFERVLSLGAERNYEISNNQVGAADITGLRFDYRNVSQVAIDYLIQRITTGGGAVEKLETGIFLLVYKPTSNSWSKVSIGTSGPDVSGVTLTVTATGQVQYTSTNITGTHSISKITWRARTLAAKHTSYSTVGSR